MKIFKHILIILGIILIASYLRYDYYNKQYIDKRIDLNRERITEIETSNFQRELEKPVILTDDKLNNDNYYNFDKVEKLSLFKMIESRFIKEFYTIDRQCNNIYNIDKFGITQHITHSDGFTSIISIEDKNCIIGNSNIFIRVIDNDNNVLDYDDIIKFIKDYHKE